MTYNKIEFRYVVENGNDIVCSLAECHWNELSIVKQMLLRFVDQVLSQGLTWDDKNLSIKRVPSEVDNGS